MFNKLRKSQNKEFYKKILNLALPITLQQFMLALISACDAFMLGGLNQESLSAVSLASQITFVFNLILTALTIGENMFIAQYYGKKDYLGVKKIVELVSLYVISVALIFLIATLAMPQLLMKIFTNDQVLIEYGIRYLKIVGISYVFSGMLQVLQGLLKNCGYAIRSTLISLVVVILNIFLNAVLIYGYLNFPRMEIAGAALATVISNVVGLIIAIIMVCLKKELRINKEDIKNKNIHINSEFWKYVAPVLLNELVWGGGFTMYSVILGHLGDDAVAANSIANITKNLLICICSGFGYGGSIIIGNLLGEGKLEEAKIYGKSLCKISIISGFITGILILALTPLILMFVNLNDVSKDYLKYMLFISSYYVVGKSINSMTIGGIFPSGGDTKFGLICDAITMWCFAVPLGSIAAFILKRPLIAVYFILNLDEIVKLPAVYLHYKKYKWVKNLIEKEN